MNTSSRSKSGLFLMELIIVVVFFAICAAICMKVFAQAKKYNDTGYQLNNATVLCQNCAECFRAYDGNVIKTADKLGAAESSAEKAVFYYGSDFKSVSSVKKAYYSMTLTRTLANGTYTAVINVCKKDGSSIQKITCAAVKGA